MDTRGLCWYQAPNPHRVQLKERSQLRIASWLPKLSTLKKRKKHNLKVENYVLFSRVAEDLSPEGSLSDSSEGLLHRGKGGARLYRSFATKIR